MTPQTITAIVMLVCAGIVIGLMAWGWRGRVKRDAHLQAPFGSFEITENTFVDNAVLYVATSEHDNALNRLAINGLAFRERLSVAVDKPGVMLGTGSNAILIPAADIVSISRATVTIDKVVERDGMLRLSWRVTPDTIVDSFLRVQHASQSDLLAAIEHLTVAPSVTGTDA